MILATIIFAFIIIASTVLLRNSQSSPMFLQKFSNDTVSIVAKVVDWPLKLLDNGTTSVKNLINTYEENNYLKEKIDDLAQTKVRNTTLENENKELKAALKLKDSLTEYKLIVGTVISRSPNSWSDSVVIDQGTNSGVKKNMLVMSGSGLIGQVIEADTVSSKVELLNTSNKSANKIPIEARLADGNVVHGIISGYNSKSGNLQLTQTESSSDLKKGTKIYTSGLGGSSPKGLLVGTVTKTVKDSFGLSNVIEIKPATDLNDFSVVSVVKREASENHE